MAAAAYGSPFATNLTGGLLSDVMQGLVPGYSGGGLLDSNPQQAQPQPAKAAPAPAQAPSVPADTAAPSVPSYSDADQIAQLIAKNRPSRLQALLHAWGTGQDFNSAQADLTKRNISNALLPQQIAMQQQEIAYGYGIKDPDLRNLYFTNPAAYAEVMKGQLGSTDLAPGHVKVNGRTPVASAPVDVAPDHSLLSPVTGENVGTAPSGPTVLAPSQTLFPGGARPGIPYTAPAAPQVVTTGPGQTSKLVTPGQPSANVGTPGQASPFDLSQVQKNPAAFFGGVFGKPVTISSGARTPQQNSAVGGVPNSAHLSDQAWDIPNLGMSAQSVAASLKTAGVPFDQVIDEGDHTHVSLSPRARGMVLIGRNGSYQVAPNGNGAQAQRGPSVQTISQGETPHQLVTPQERAANGILPSDKAGYKLMTDGTVARSAEDPFGPSQQMEYTTKALSFEPLKNYITTRGFLDAAKQSMQQKGGFADLNLIDMAGKSVNPTLAMRPNMIEQFGKERGWTDEVIGKIRSTMEHGQALDDAARNALYNTIYTNTQAHYNASKGMIDKIKRDASKYGLTPQDLIPDLQEMPAAPSPSYGGNASDQAISAAKDAIRRGAPRAAVIKRLRDNGINPAGL